MKTFATAMALVLAFPAAAQTAPAPAQHQGHQQTQGHDAHTQHQAGQQGAQHQGGQHQGGQHDGHAQGDGCCADRNNNGRMDCCENMSQGTEQRGCCAQGHGQPAATPQGDPDS